MYKRQFNKICAICGDKSSGRNFGAISCESCKAFFRRAMTVTDKIWVCSHHNNCQIDEQSRKFCKKCRLDKCFAKGMRKEFIFSNERGSDQKNMNCSDEESATKQSQCLSTSSSSSSSEDMASNQMSLNHCPDTDIISEFNLLIDDCPTDEDLSLEIPEMEELLTNLEKNSAAEVPPTETTITSQPIVKPINTFDKPLNELEISRLQELSRASEHLFPAKTSLHNEIEIHSMGQMYEAIAAHDMAEPVVRSLIRFCKNISPFQDICEQDRCALFKNSNFMLLQISQIPHNVQDDPGTICNVTYRFEKHTLRVHSIDFQQGDHHLFNMGLRFWQNLNPEWSRDPILINLLMSVVLFNCELPDLTHKANIKFKQQMYFYLLQRYLLQKFRSNDKLCQSLAQMMNVRTDLHQINLYNRQFAQNYRHLFSPLINEIIDT